MPKALPIIVVLLIIFQTNSTISAQGYERSLNNSFDHFGRYVYAQKDSSVHTSIKPYRRSKLKEIVDLDTTSLHKEINGKWKNKLFNNSLVEFSSEQFQFTIDPLFDFQVGNGKTNYYYSYTNTRGVIINATINEKLNIQTAFRESQSFFPDIHNSLVDSLGVVPGQGHPKAFKDSGFDYASSEAYITYSPSSVFELSAGHGKHFIGDGYRSLLLSDAGFNYPFAKIDANVWRLKYLAMWAQFQEPNFNEVYAIGNPKKWGAFHYLDINVCSWFNIGLFEAIIWENADSLGNHRGFDPNYANPVIFMRPVEFSNGSPDNVLMGLNGKISITHNLHLYGQAVIDEFNLQYLREKNGWWGNKWGIQAGMKSFDLFKISNLDFQTEYSMVRPFMYTHFSVMQNYGHYGQPLAHPLGANFTEAVAILKYRYKRFYLQNKSSYAITGSDIDSVNYGSNIYKSYITRSDEFGHTMLQGEKTSIIHNDFSISYLLNPTTNMNITVGYAMKMYENSINTFDQSLIYFAFRTSLQNKYFDF